MPDRVGQKIGNYQLVQLLGTGGFAEVYLGQHTLLHTMQVAVKLLHGELGRNNRDGFFQEAETIAGLKHPQIIRLLEFGVEGDTHNPYLIMDYAPQGTLRSKYPKGSMLPLATVSGYVKQIAEALQYAHDRNRIHCDLKPENLLIGENSEILLSDFGIAAIAQNTEQMKTNPYAGTVAYSAPEQIFGKPRRESDQYALGIIVYEWLSGNRPFKGTPYEIMYKQINATPPPLRTVPSEVETLVMKALEKDPYQRFESMREFAEAFEQAYTAGTSSTFSRGQPLPDQQQNIKGHVVSPDQPPRRSQSQKGDLDIRQPSQQSDMRTPRITQDISDVTSGRRTEQSLPATTDRGSFGSFPSPAGQTRHTTNRQEIAPIDGETVLRRVRNGNIPSTWRILRGSPVRLFLWSVLVFMLPSGSVTWFIIATAGASLNFSIIGVATVLGGIILGGIIGIVFFLFVWKDDKKKLVVLLPQGYVYGQKDLARVYHVLNFNEALAVRAKGNTVRIIYNQKNGGKTTEYQVLEKAIAQAIADAYLKFERLHFPSH
jgi:serine/threonine protein kinase